MKKLNLLIVAVMAMLLISSCRTFKKELTAEEKEKQAEIASALPFGVQIGGQSAQLDNEFCAKIPKPVSSDSAIKVDTQAIDSIVVTVTPGTANGLVKAGFQPVVIIIDGQTSALDKTFSGKKLKPGKYIMRVNADNKIASLLFEIK